MNKKKLDISELFLSGLTLLGVSLIFHFDTSYRTGIILGTISSFFGSLYIMTNEKLVRRYDSTMINYYQLLGATIGLGLLLPVYRREPGGKRNICRSEQANSVAVS